MAHLLGYARVSTLDQNPQLQADELAAAGCYRVFTDHASGAAASRPKLDEVLDQLRPGDTLVVWRLDRLGRSLRHLIDVVTSLEARDVGFRSLRENIDTTTPTGRLVFHMFGSLAEFERDLIRERTAAGLAAARARGRNGGRPPKMKPDKAALARRMYDERTHTLEQIAEVLGVSRSTVVRSLLRLVPAAADAEPRLTRPEGP
jgi:DNA invertase Pin-like site-specific DNA recombinase